MTAMQCRCWSCLHRESGPRAFWVPYLAFMDKASCVRLRGRVGTLQQESVLPRFLLFLNTTQPHPLFLHHAPSPIAASKLSRSLSISASALLRPFLLFPSPKLSQRPQDGYSGRPPWDPVAWYASRSFCCLPRHVSGDPTNLPSSQTRVHVRLPNNSCSMLLSRTL